MEQTLKCNEVYNGFRVHRAEAVTELNSYAYEMEHLQSGARLLYLANDDDNKVFSVSFRTTPQNSTGVPHICEHSTLCGSRKFPLKEPFVELVKGSLNTFLNAMTFPDKTMYPVASRNDRDFRNLMDVYLDAVFFPNMLHDEQILMQEGWHYEMATPEEPLTYCGVVYNEMKGVFSSPDAQLERRIMENLFPDTTYGVESGGDPDVIPTLTQSAFTAFHKRYYHPSNSYIFLYGNMDIDATLSFIDSEYLSRFTATAVHSEIGRQPSRSPLVKSYAYGIASEEKTAQKTLHSLTYVIDDALDPTLGLAMKVLTYVFLLSPAAPLKKALVDAGVGKDISGDFQDGLLQPLWGITVNGSEPEMAGEILPVVRRVLQDSVERGLDKVLLTGALNRIEFSLREADFAGRPKGLIYGIRCMDTWLYDGDPLAALHYEEALRVLRAGIENGYYEDIIKKYILDNSYYALISLVPEKGLAERRDKALAEKLAAYKASLSAAEIAAIVAATRALKEKQGTPDTPEALLSIPTLARQDLKKEAECVDFTVTAAAGVSLCHVPDVTNGISYVEACFDLRGLSEEEISYVYLLSDLLGDMDTTAHEYGELASLIDLYTGGISYGVEAFSKQDSPDEYVPVFRIKAKSLDTHVDKLIDLLREISLQTVFTNAARLAELIEETKTGWDMDAFSRGQTLVMHRLLSYVSAAEGFADAGELSYYAFVSKIAASIREDGGVTAAALAAVLKKIIVRSRMTVAVTGDVAAEKRVRRLLPQWTDAMEEGEAGGSTCSFDRTVKNEGIMTSGTVQYVAKGGNFRKHGFSYTGVMLVLSTILQYEYLWTKIRVQGGAYGAFTRFYRNGNMVFCSYRDPNLGNSLQAYDDLADYLQQFDVSDREMTKYVIGTLSRVDTPLTPALRTAKALSRHYSGVTKEWAQQIRDQLLAATAADIRALAPLVRAVMQDNQLCVLGSETKIREDASLFKNLISLPN